jgi:VCBS repeat-containing protein
VPDASPAWNDTAAAISNANNVRFTSGAPATYPAAGHTYVWTPTDASVDWANLQWISNTTPYTCQPVDVYTQGYEPGVTNSAGAGAGVAVWVGKMASATDSDPSTWPESAWTSATYNVDSGNNDEFKLTLSGLAAGSYRIATRWKINSGPYKYGATNNAFYNGTTSITGLVTVSAPPAITATATPSTPICAGTSVTLAASSAGSYTYSWNNGAGTGASVSVSPTATTTYTVTGTDTVSGCTNTATVTVTVNPSPSAVDITTPNTSLCADAIQMLTATGGLVPVPSTVVNETFTGITAFPSGWSTNIGSGDTIAITATSSAGGSANQVVVTGNSTSAITDRVIYGPFDSTGATSVILSWKNYLEHYSATYPYSVKIQTSTNGTTWTDSSWGTANVSTSIGPGNQSTTLTTADVGSATLYISFTVTGQTFGFYNWNLDNIVVSKTVLTSQIVWTSTPASPNTMFTDAACTTAYKVQTIEQRCM